MLMTAQKSERYSGLAGWSKKQWAKWLDENSYSRSVIVDMRREIQKTALTNEVSMV